MKNNKASNGAPATGAQGKGEETLRRISTKRVAQNNRVMNGAEKRMLRLQTELAENRAIIRRKYTDVFDAKDNVIGRNMLSPEQVLGFRFKRTQIEKDLAIAKGDFLKARREYRSAVTNNFQIERKSVQLIREENRIERESKKLMRQTKEILRAHGNNGGETEFQVLKTLAVTGDVKAFRTGFNDVLGKFDPSHYTTISGVSSVKTEIMHSIMDQLAEEEEKKNSETSEGGAQ